MGNNPSDIEIDISEAKVPTALNTLDHLLLSYPLSLVTCHSRHLSRTQLKIALDQLVGRHLLLVLQDSLDPFHHLIGEDPNHVQ